MKLDQLTKSSIFSALALEDTTWTDRSGEEHNISEMSPSYIFSVYCMLTKTIKERDDIDSILEMNSKKIKIPVLIIERYNKLKETHPELFL